ncbi:Uncharacterised protein [Arcanobacterium haemolyticum]|uniref:hypothetical protein n=1 Tax=Arcanobacterium haemolyticum TaxID=28264 RepID=UPI000D911F7A|nr:hypothetical protein [Arcanobacterium haemolyticum]SPT74725.1 Uncharacterised protein [Arcanobacterium haemolyticum]
MNSSFRRPAQLRPEQLEVLEGDVNIEARLELAYTTARALVSFDQPGDPDVVERVHDLIDNEGIDVVAESWMDAPATSLPGILWRGFLLREWIRRFPEDAKMRYAAALAAGVESEGVPTLEQAKAEWDSVFSIDSSRKIVDVLRDSARLTDFLARVEPLWIETDEHPLATEVTRRSTAMKRTSDEFREVGEELKQASDLI